MTHLSTTTTELRKEIRYDRATRDYAMYYEGELIGFTRTSHEAEVTLNQYVYDLLTHGGCETATAFDGGQDDDPPVDDGPDDNWGGFRQERAGMVIPNSGLHLIQYTVVTSQSDEAFSYDLKILCGDCRSKTPGASKMGEVVNGFCDACGAGPSVSHFQLATAIDDPLPDPGPGGPGVPGDERPRCTACDTSDYVMSSTHPGICLGCSNARYWGFASRLEAEPHAWVLPVPILYCSGCLCVAEQLDANAWRCRNPQCLSVWRRDDLLTTSELIKRRAALERIRVAVMERVLCKNCGGFHSIQKCPELFGTLFIGAPDVDLGRDLVRMLRHNHTSFVAMLINAEPPRLLHYAESYAAFIAAHNPSTTLTGEKVLARWAREMEPEPTPIAMEMAA